MTGPSEYLMRPMQSEAEARVAAALKVAREGLWFFGSDDRPDTAKVCGEYAESYLMHIVRILSGAPQDEAQAHPAQPHKET